MNLVKVELTSERQHASRAARSLQSGEVPQRLLRAGGDAWVREG